MQIHCKIVRGSLFECNLLNVRKKALLEAFGDGLGSDLCEIAQQQNMFTCEG